MKKWTLLTVLLFLLVFSSGFLAGKLFSTDSQNKASRTSTPTPVSVKKLEQKQLPKWTENQQSVLIGYVQDFRDPNVIEYSKLTHVIFSFAHPTSDGEILLNGDHAQKNLQMVKTLAHNSGTKVMLAVGGWYHIRGGESYSYFKSAISNPTSRTKLVSELSAIAEREGLDGIDVDFEHPRSLEDAKNLTLFIKELSEVLHPSAKELSIAVHAKIHGGTLTEAQFVKYEPSMFQYVDHVNIMAYDGQWDGGYNGANLSPYPFTEKIVSYWTQLFDSQNLSKEKLVLGVPFYAQPEDPKQKQVSYETIIKSNPNNANQDMMVLNGITYYFNGGSTMKRKTQLALDHGFGGMMLWEVGLDAEGPQSLTSTIFEVLEQNRNI
ncbi:glycoside hydrolase family 18 protein [Bacillus sp. T3]|uniref:glycoside hydrolase family 18 protein n=1 Tax=Bacillus sp. T3 TaxID=467262 RepID=UPI002980E2C1|nr:glycoside hydrolase family 18 protein [Bacillus sp. T3]